MDLAVQRAVEVDRCRVAARRRRSAVGHLWSNAVLPQGLRVSGDRLVDLKVLLTAMTDSVYCFVLMHVLHYNDHNASFAIKTTVDTSAFSPEKRIQKLRLHFNAHFALKMIVEQYRFH